MQMILWKNSWVEKEFMDNFLAKLPKQMKS